MESLRLRINLFSKNVSTLFTIIMMLFLLATAQPQDQNWVKYASNPILPLGSSGSWDDNHAYMPFVVKDGSTYKMWYGGHDGSNTRFGYATSSDGISWTKYGSNPVLNLGTSGSFDEKYLNDPYVMKDGTTYKMWYTGADNSGNYQIGYATSSDGISWTKYGSNPVLTTGTSGQWDDTYVAHPVVIKDGSTYKMWYSGHDGSGWRIGYATSSDGITWTKYTSNPVLDKGSAGTWDANATGLTFLMKDENVYRLWYGGYDGTHNRVGYAESTDGINWEKLPDYVIDVGTSGEWDDYHTGLYSVIKEGNVFKGWLSAAGYTPYHWRVGYATFDAPGLVSHWAFDEGTGSVAGDSTGDNDGTIYGASWVDGVSRNALNFDGVDDYVEAPSFDLIITDPSEISVSVWFKPENLNHLAQIFGPENYEPLSRSIVINYDTREEHSRNFVDVLAYDGTNYKNYRLHGDTFTDNSWHHLFVSFDSGTVTIYHNGIDVTASADEYISGSVSEINIPSTKLNIGACQYAPESRFFDGSIDEVRIYNYALSSSEVIAIYDSEKPPVDVSSWQYVMPLTVSETSGTTLTDFQIKVTVDTATLISEGKMETDCSDILFTNNVGQDIPFWVEAGCNSVQTEIWVKVPELLASADTAINIYYGNSATTSLSSGENTFVFFDGFDGASLDLTKWAEEGSGFSVSGGHLFFDDEGSRGIINSYQEISAPMISHARFKLEKLGSNGIHPHLFGTLDHNNYVDVQTHGTDHFRFVTKKDGIYTLHWTDTNHALNTWFDSRIVWDGTNAQYYLDNNLKADTTATVPSVDLRVRLVESATAGSGDGWLDWIFVREYTTSEPTVVVGEEVNNGLIAYWSFDDSLDDNVHNYDASSPNGNTFRSGVSGEAVELDGIDQYIDGQNPLENALNAFTYTGWFYLDAQGHEHYTPAFSHDNLVTSHNNDVFDCTMGWGSNDFGCSGFFTDQTIFDTRVGNTPPVGQWFMYTWTYNGSEMNTYYDGQMISTNVYSGKTLQSGETLKLGLTNNRPGGVSTVRTLDGAIDEFRVYNYALSASEIEAQYEAEKPPALVAHWAFDEGSGTVAGDSVGNNNGTLQGGASWKAGISGNALDLDGIDDYVVIPHSTNLDVSNKNISASLWFKSPDWTGVSELYGGVLLEKRVDDRPYYFNVGISGTGQIRASVRDDFRRADARLYTTPNDNLWHMVAFTWEQSTGTLKLFVDGQLVDTQVNTDIGDIDEGGSIFIGNADRNPDNVNTFEGLIDDVRIYNVILSAQNIQDQYEAEKPPELVAHWTFDEGSGSVAGDSAGGSDGNITGASWTTGISGTALLFDGDEDYVRIPHTTALNPGIGNFSISHWFRLDATETPPQLYYVFYQKTGSGGVGGGPGGFESDKYTNQIRFDMDQFSANFRDENSNEDSVIATQSISDGKFHHMAVVRDVTNSQLHLYLDGALDRTITLTAIGDISPENDLIIGAMEQYDSDQIERNLIGVIDELKMYNYALSAQEVLDLYNEETCGNGVCVGDETALTCPEDCTVCGDSYCTGDETALTCADDCTTCGDGYCTGDETALTCADDCTVCSDGYCTGDETALTCADDCTVCSDGYCTGNETEVSCAVDCDVTDPVITLTSHSNGDTIAPGEILEFNITDVNLDNAWWSIDGGIMQTPFFSDLEYYPDFATALDPHCVEPPVADHTCPTGMVFINECGGFCIDQYEAYNDNGAAGSASGQTPWVGSWNTAVAACAAAGKYLCNDYQWMAACNLGGEKYFLNTEEYNEAYGCNTYSGSNQATGSNPNCKSDKDIYDMVGNVWEFTQPLIASSDWGGARQSVASVLGESESKYGYDWIQRKSSSLNKAMLRGGSRYTGEASNTKGCFSIAFNYGATREGLDYGFRCCSEPLTPVEKLARIDTSDWSTGSVELVVHADDEAANVAEENFTFTVGVCGDDVCGGDEDENNCPEDCDVTNPVITLTSHLNGATIAPGEILRFELSDVNLDTYWWSDDNGVSQYSFSTVSGTDPVTVTINTSQFAIAPVDILVHADDTAANVGEQAYQFTVSRCGDGVLQAEENLDNCFADAGLYLSVLHTIESTGYFGDIVSITGTLSLESTPVSYDLEISVAPKDFINPRRLSLSSDDQGEFSTFIYLDGSQETDYEMKIYTNDLVIKIDEFTLVPKPIVVTTSIISPTTVVTGEIFSVRAEAKNHLETTELVNISLEIPGIMQILTVPEGCMLTGNNGIDCACDSVSPQGTCDIEIAVLAPLQIQGEEIHVIEASAQIESTIDYKSQGVKVRPRNFGVTITENNIVTIPNKTISLETYVSNYEELSDIYSLTLDGIPQEWTISVPETIGVDAQGVEIINVEIEIPEGCQTDGTYEIVLYAESNETSRVRASNSVYLVVNALPIISTVVPKAKTVANQDVTVSWLTQLESDSYAEISGVQNVTSTTPTKSHSLTFTNLERHQNYDFVVTSCNECGCNSDTSTFYVDTGVVFNQSLYSGLIRRDYNQKVYVRVKNIDVVPHNVTLQPVEMSVELPFGFMGPGSVFENLELQPGQEKEILMLVFAPDAKDEVYNLRINLTDETGSSDLATFRINIEPYDLMNFTVENPIWNVNGSDISTLTHEFIVTNVGPVPIPDLKVHAKGDLAPFIRFKPYFRHVRLDVGESLKILGYLEAITEIPEGLNASIVFEGSPTVAGAMTTVEEVTQTCVIKSSDDVIVRFDRSSYCTNKPYFETPFDMLFLFGNGDLDTEVTNAQLAFFIVHGDSHQKTFSHPMDIYVNRRKAATVTIEKSDDQEFYEPPLNERLFNYPYPTVKDRGTTTFGGTELNYALFHEHMGYHALTRGGHYAVVADPWIQLGVENVFQCTYGCGDKICKGEETTTTCPEDCFAHGDGECTVGYEDSSNACIDCGCTTAGTCVDESSYKSFCFPYIHDPNLFESDFESITLSDKTSEVPVTLNIDNKGSAPIFLYLEDLQNVEGFSFKNTGPDTSYSIPVDETSITLPLEISADVEPGEYNVQLKIWGGKGFSGESVIKTLDVVYNCDNDSKCEETDESTETCPGDCHCGVNNCQIDKGENNANCDIDCYCGDGFCHSGDENIVSCPVDCAASCGNGVCDSGNGETQINCCKDCGCNPDETCFNDVCTVIEGSLAINVMPPSFDIKTKKSETVIIELINGEAGPIEISVSANELEGFFISGGRSIQALPGVPSEVTFGVYASSSVESGVHSMVVHVCTDTGCEQEDIIVSIPITVTCDDDGNCEATETSESCRFDCPCNSDGTCDELEGETDANCHEDCHWDNGICETGGSENEDCETAPDDCACEFPEICLLSAFDADAQGCARCGNTFCEESVGETDSNCPGDCRSGDGECSPHIGEYCDTVPEDCSCDREGGTCVHSSPGHCSEYFSEISVTVLPDKVRFSPGETSLFKVRIKNNGDKDIERLFNRVKTELLPENSNAIPDIKEIYYIEREDYYEFVQTVYIPGDVTIDTLNTEIRVSSERIDLFITDDESCLSECESYPLTFVRTPRDVIDFEKIFLWTEDVTKQFTFIDTCDEVEIRNVIGRRNNNVITTYFTHTGTGTTYDITLDTDTLKDPVNKAYIWDAYEGVAVCIKDSNLVDMIGINVQIPPKTYPVLEEDLMLDLPNEEDLPTFVEKISRMNPEYLSLYPLLKDRSLTKKCFNALSKCTKGNLEYYLNNPYDCISEYDSNGDCDGMLPQNNENYPLEEFIKALKTEMPTLKICLGHEDGYWHRQIIFDTSFVGDVDGDGISNSIDGDIDNDGLINEEDTDMDGNSIDDVDEDQDNDGTPVGIDQDIDNDGIPNNEDDDIDNDGILNNEDDDIDNDGILNNEDNNNGNSDEDETKNKYAHPLLFALNDLKAISKWNTLREENPLAKFDCYGLYIEGGSFSTTISQYNMIMDDCRTKCIEYCEEDKLFNDIETVAYLKNVNCLDLCSISEDVESYCMFRYSWNRVLNPYEGEVSNPKHCVYPPDETDYGNNYPPTLCIDHLTYDKSSCGCSKEIPLDPECKDPCELKTDDIELSLHELKTIFNDNINDACNDYSFRHMYCSRRSRFENLHLETGYDDIIEIKTPEDLSPDDLDRGYNVHSEAIFARYGWEKILKIIRKETDISNIEYIKMALPPITVYNSKWSLTGYFDREKPYAGYDYDYIPHRLTNNEERINEVNGDIPQVKTLLIPFYLMDNIGKYINENPNEELGPHKMTQISNSAYSFNTAQKELFMAYPNSQFFFSPSMFTREKPLSKYWADVVNGLPKGGFWSHMFESSENYYMTPRNRAALYHNFYGSFFGHINGIEPEPEICNENNDFNGGYLNEETIPLYSEISTQINIFDLMRNQEVDWLFAGLNNVNYINIRADVYDSRPFLLFPEENDEKPIHFSNSFIDSNSLDPNDDTCNIGFTHWIDYLGPGSAGIETELYQMLSVFNSLKNSDYDLPKPNFLPSLGMYYIGGTNIARSSNIVFGDSITDSRIIEKFENGEGINPHLSHYFYEHDDMLMPIFEPGYSIRPDEVLIQCYQIGNNVECSIENRAPFTLDIETLYLPIWMNSDNQNFEEKSNIEFKCNSDCDIPTGEFKFINLSPKYFETNKRYGMIILKLEKSGYLTGTFVYDPGQSSDVYTFADTINTDQWHWYEFNVSTENADAIESLVSWNNSANIDLHFISPDGTHYGFNYTEGRTIPSDKLTGYYPGTSKLDDYSGAFRPSEGMLITAPEQGLWTAGVYGESAYLEEYNLKIRVVYETELNIVNVFSPDLVKLNDTFDVIVELNNTGDSGVRGSVFVDLLGTIAETYVSIPGYSSYNATISVTAPLVNNTDEHILQIFTNLFTVGSQSVVESINTSLTIAAPEFNLNIIPETQSINPGENTTYTIELNNTGIVDDTIELSIEGLPQEWLTYDENVELISGEVQTIVLTVIVPRICTAITSNYGFSVSALSQLTYNEIENNAELFVEPYYDVSVVVNPLNQTTNANIPVEYDVILNNTGNNNIVLNNTVIGLPENVFSYPSTVEISNCGSTEFTINVNIPKNDLIAGQHELTVTSQLSGECSVSEIFTLNLLHIPTVISDPSIAGRGNDPVTLVITMLDADAEAILHEEEAKELVLEYYSGTAWVELGRETLAGGEVTFNFNIPDEDPDTYDLKVSFAGDARYAASEITGVLTITSGEDVPICPTLGDVVTYTDTGFAPDCPGLDPDAYRFVLVDSNCDPIEDARINLRKANDAYITNKKTDENGTVDFSEYNASDASKFEVDYNGAKYSTEIGSFTNGTRVQTQNYNLTFIGSNCQAMENVRVNLRKSNDAYVTNVKTNADGTAAFEIVPEVQMKLEIDFNGGKWSSQATTADHDIIVGAQAFELLLLNSLAEPINDARINLRKENNAYVTHTYTNSEGKAFFDVVPNASLKHEADYNGAQYSTAPSISHEQQVIQTYGFTLNLTSSYGYPVIDARVNLRKANNAYVTHQFTSVEGLATFEVVPQAEMLLEVDYNGAKNATEVTTITQNTELEMQLLLFGINLTDTEGLPIEGARINLRKANGAYVTHTFTDVEGLGRFQVVPSAEMILEVDYNGDKYQTEAIVVTENQIISVEFDVIVEVQALALAMAVTDSSGTPIENARVNLRKANNAYITNVRTNVDGIASFEVVPDAEHKLELDYNGAKYKTDVITVTETVTVDVQTLAFSLSLTDSLAQPIENARINLRKSNNAYVTNVKTGMDGISSFEVVPGAQMKLEVDYNGAKYQTAVTTVNANTQLNVQTLPFTLYLTDSYTDPIENARINLRKSNNAYVTNKKTDIDGYVTFEVVPDAQMILEADYNGGKYATPVTTVSTATQLDVQAVQLTAHITVNSVDLEDQRVDLLKSNGAYVTNLKTDYEGRARFEVLPGAEHKLRSTYDSVTWVSDVVTGPGEVSQDFQ